MLQELISGGAKVDLKDIYGNTALMYAAVRGEAAVVSLLIESKADFNAQNQKIMNLC
ncbi:MAG: ankyrin repeat domain-containing protein [Gammaproteobacteria bacterium]|nr:ankyrin repeat domain-containing protein [Gammaproteobacteria bacterium]